MSLPILTPRLELRDFRLDDFPGVHAYASDPLVTRYTSFGPNTEEETLTFLGAATAEPSQKPRANYSLAVIERASAALVGGCVLLGRGDRIFEIGYVLNREWWGRGIATEIVGGLLGFAFGELSAHRIVGRVAPDNEPSTRVLTRHGFQREGLLRQDTCVRGEWQDSLLYSLLAHEAPGMAITPPAAGAAPARPEP